MMQASLSDHELAQAMAAVDDTATPLPDRVDMLVEIAMRLQNQPRDLAQLEASVKLYDRALALAESGGLSELSLARISARRATAMMQMPNSPERYEAIVRALQAAREVLETRGQAEETAECDMNLGLAIQSGHAVGAIPMAIQAYQRALKVFTRDAYPREFAILHSNLATAYLETPVQGQAGKMREALAVQSFESALQAINLNEHPNEYAMLQNNLGNALQYASSGHPLENNLRALQAYEEALKVRTQRDTPIEYANTLANMGNCISNLPDDLDDPASADAHNPLNLQRAIDYYREAQSLFAGHGEADKARIVEQVLQDLQQEVADA